MLRVGSLVKLSPALRDGAAGPIETKPRNRMKTDKGGASRTGAGGQRDGGAAAGGAAKAANATVEGTQAGDNPKTAAPPKRGKPAPGATAPSSAASIQAPSIAPAAAAATSSGATLAHAKRTSPSAPAFAAESLQVVTSSPATASCAPGGMPTAITAAPAVAATPAAGHLPNASDAPKVGSQGTAKGGGGVPDTPDAPKGGAVKGGGGGCAGEATQAPTDVCGGAMAVGTHASAGQGAFAVGASALAKKSAPPPPSFLRFSLVDETVDEASTVSRAEAEAEALARAAAGVDGGMGWQHRLGAWLPSRPGGGGGSTTASRAAGRRTSVAQTVGQPYSGIRAEYNWEEVTGAGNLQLELPAGSTRPPQLLVQLWEDPNFAKVNRMRVPKLEALQGLRPPTRAREDTSSAGDDGTALLALPETPLASAVITLPSYGAAGPHELAEPAHDAQGEMQVTLSGRTGLGKDYKVSFNYQISIW